MFPPRIEEMDEGVPNLVASYAEAACKSMKAVIQKLETWQLTRPLLDQCFITGAAARNA